MQLVLWSFYTTPREEDFRKQPSLGYLAKGEAEWARNQTTNHTETSVAPSIASSACSFLALIVA